MATFREVLTGRGIPGDVARFMQGAIRKSTIGTYSTAWTAWCKWCQEGHLDVFSVSVTKLLEFCHFLFGERKLAASSICVYKTAICSILQPGVQAPASSHPLLNKFLKAAFLQRPPAFRRVRTTWDVATVLGVLAEQGEAHSTDMPLLAKKTLFLVALLAIKRLSDVSLLDTAEQFMCVTNKRVVLQPKFGAKQERRGHKIYSLLLFPHLDQCDYLPCGLGCWTSLHWQEYGTLHLGRQGQRQPHWPWQPMRPWQPSWQRATGRLPDISTVTTLVRFQRTFLRDLPLKAQRRRRSSQI